MKILILFAVLYAVSMINVASAQCDKFADNNYSALRNQTYFSYEYTDALKMRAAFAQEYVCIKTGENPEKDFESLLQNSTLAGQLYGLYGLSEVSPDRYEIVKSRYEKKHEFVSFISFDVGHCIPASKIALTFLTRIEDEKQAHAKMMRYLNDPERQQKLLEDLRREKERLRKREASASMQSMDQPLDE